MKESSIMQNFAVLYKSLSKTLPTLILDYLSSEQPSLARCRRAQINHHFTKEALKWDSFSLMLLNVAGSKSVPNGHN